MQQHLGWRKYNMAWSTAQDESEHALGQSLTENKQTEESRKELTCANNKKGERAPKEGPCLASKDRRKEPTVDTTVGSGQPTAIDGYMTEVCI